MKRISIFISEVQYLALKRLSDATGLGMSELIRRAIDMLLKKRGKI